MLEEEVVSPLRRRHALEPRREAHPVGGDRRHDAGQLCDRWRDIDVQHDGVTYDRAAAGARVAHEHRNAQALFVGILLGLRKGAMLAPRNAVVTGHDDHRVVIDAELHQVVEQHGQVLVYGQEALVCTTANGVGEDDEAK
jgi:hypothetical protein